MCNQAKELIRDRVTEKPSPVAFETFTLKYQEVSPRLSAIGLVRMMGSGFVRDLDIVCTDLQGWNRVGPHLTFPAALYVASVSDCDDYADAAKVVASFQFGMNGCLMCHGDAVIDGVNTRHAFNILVMPTGFVLLEANAGFPHAGVPFLIGEHGYQPEGWRL